MLKHLVSIARLGLVTNGLGEVQRTRIERLDIARYFEAVVISGEVGTAKPGSAIFDIAFEQLGRPNLDSALMVGDSLSSDMAGGVGYGIATCWYNPHGRPATTAVSHEIRTLEELIGLATET